MLLCPNNMLSQSSSSGKKLMLVTKIDSAIVSALFIGYNDSTITVLSNNGIIDIKLDSIYSIQIKKYEKPSPMYLISGFLSFVAGSALWGSETDISENFLGFALQAGGVLGGMAYGLSEPEERDYVFYLSPLDDPMTNKERLRKIEQHLKTDTEKDRFSIFINTGFQYAGFTRNIAGIHNNWNDYHYGNHSFNIIRNFGISVPVYDGIEIGITYSNLNEPGLRLSKYKEGISNYISAEYKAKALHLMLIYKYLLFGEKVQVKGGIGFGTRNMDYNIDSRYEKRIENSYLFDITKNNNSGSIKNAASAELDLSLLFKVTMRLRMGINLNYVFLSKIELPEDDLFTFDKQKIKCDNGSFGFHFGFNF